MKATTATKVKFLRPETSINHKLGKIKFEEAFDALVITKAENAIAKHKNSFDAEIRAQFNEVLADFLMNYSNQLSVTDYHNISEAMFSIKSRAGLAGLNIISEVANSLYKFAEKAADILPSNGYMVVKLHLDAMIEVFENKFPKDNDLAANRLMNGLTKVALKYAN